MLTDKMTKVLTGKKWIAYKTLEPFILKPTYNINRTFTNNSQRIKKLLYSNKLTCVSFTMRCNQTLPSLKENVHAYKVMANLTAYSNSISETPSVAEDLSINSIENLLEKQWICMSNSEIVENFKLLSSYAHKNFEDINSIKYKGIFEILADKCSSFSNEELMNFLGPLQLWNSRTWTNHILWSPLNQTCLERLPNLNYEQIFLISDYFYKMNVLRYSSFVYNSMIKLDMSQMTPANLVQYAFFMKVMGIIQSVKTDKFEFCVEKNIDKFSIEELGIICMAFFKYQTAINSNKLLLKIIQMVQADLDNVSDISLASILKALRYSADLNIVKVFDVFLNSLQDQIPNRQFLTLTHILMTLATLLIHNKSLIQKIIERFENEIETVRLKDIERVLFALYIFDYDPTTTPFYELATKELQSPRRADEISKYMRPYVYCSMFMLQVNYLPKEIVNRIMTEDFINKFCENDINTLDREYLIIDYCLQIDHPDYKGPRLKKYQLKYLLNKFGVFHYDSFRKYHKSDRSSKLLMDIGHHIKLSLGSESAIHMDYLLPYYNKQFIVVCYDPTSASFVPPKDPIKEIPLGEIKYAPKDGKQWAVIISASHNHLTRIENQPTGILSMKMRHMQRIGYTPISIPHNEWNLLRRTNNKIQYMQKILERLQSQVST